MTILSEALLSLPTIPLAGGGSPWDFVAPGVWVIFVVIGLPVYTAFLGWFLGKPKQLSTTFLGLGLFFGLILSLWGGLFTITMVIRVFFF
jgi:hypothetical protein